jgi:hypothetical protein
MSFNEDMRKQFEHDLAELKKMRDEIRVKLHLAGMEVKERWKQLEPKLEEIERKVEAGSEDILGATTKLFEDVGRAFREIGERLVRKPEKSEQDETK